MKHVTVPLHEIAYLMFFVTFLGVRGLGTYAEPYMTAAFYLSAGFFLLKVLLTEHTVTEYLMIVLFTALGICISISSGNRGLLLFFMMMIGMKAVHVKRVYAAGALLLGSCMVLQTTIHTLGIRTGYFTPNRDLYRFGLGYFNPNATQYTFLVLAMMILYLQKEKDLARQILTCALLFTSSSYLYLYTASRAAHYVLILYLLLHLWLSKGPLHKLTMCLAAVSSYAVTILCMVIAVLRNVETQTANTLLNRFSNAAYAWNHFPLTLFGRDIYVLGHECDMAQMYLLMGCGIIAFLLVNAITVRYLVYCIRHDLWAELSIVSSMLLMGLMEALLYNYSFRNICFILFGGMLYALLPHRDAPVHRILPLKGQLNIPHTLLKRFSLTNRRILALTALFAAVALAGFVTARQLYPARGTYLLAGMGETVEITGENALLEYTRRQLSMGVSAATVTVLAVYAAQCYNAGRKQARS